MQALKERGVEDGQLDAEIQNKVAAANALQAADEGVSEVLLTAAQAEIGRLRSAAEAAASAQASLQQLNEVSASHLCTNLGLQIMSEHSLALPPTRPHCCRCPCSSRTRCMS